MPERAKNDAQSLFRQSPPFSAALVLGLLVLLIFAVVVTGAFIVRVPETIRCPFVLVPDGGSDPVRAARAGYLEQVAVEQRQEVRKGQVLFVIRAREMRSWMTDLRAWSTDLQSAEGELAACQGRRELRAKAHEASVEIQKAKIAQIEKDVDYQTKYLATYKDVLDRYEMLDKHGLLPKLDLLSQRVGAAKAERDAGMTRQSLEMARLELSRLERENEQQIAQDGLELQKMEVRISGLKKQMEGNPADLQSVSAPYDGMIMSLERRAAGEAVAEGQELCRLARSDCPLIAELSPSEEGVARLQLGQRVQLFYQAFPYQRYGTPYAKLDWVSPIASRTGDEVRFAARAVLDSQSVRAQGTTHQLKAGMQGESRILVGRRSLIEYAFDPIRQLKENVAPSR